MRWESPSDLGSDAREGPAWRRSGSCGGKRRCLHTRRSALHASRLNPAKYCEWNRCRVRCMRMYAVSIGGTLLSRRRVHSAVLENGPGAARAPCRARTMHSTAAFRHLGCRPAGSVGAEQHLDQARSPSRRERRPTSQRGRPLAQEPADLTRRVMGRNPWATDGRRAPWTGRERDPTVPYGVTSSSADVTACCRDRIEAFRIDRLTRVLVEAVGAFLDPLQRRVDLCQ